MAAMLSVGTLGLMASNTVEKKNYTVRRLPEGGRKVVYIDPKEYFLLRLTDGSQAALPLKDFPSENSRDEFMNAVRRALQDERVREAVQLITPVRDWYTFFSNGPSYRKLAQELRSPFFKLVDDGQYTPEYVLQCFFVAIKRGNGTYVSPFSGKPFGKRPTQAVINGEVTDDEDAGGGDTRDNLAAVPY